MAVKQASSIEDAQGLSWEPQIAGYTIGLLAGRKVAVTFLDHVIYGVLEEAGCWEQDDGRITLRVAGGGWAFEMTDAEDGCFARFNPNDESFWFSFGFGELTIGLLPDDADVGRVERAT